MRTAKEETLDLLDSLPDDVSLDEVARRLLLRARILHSRDRALRGELVSNEEVTGGPTTPSPSALSRPAL